MSEADDIQDPVVPPEALPKRTPGEQAMLDMGSGIYTACGALLEQFSRHLDQLSPAQAAALEHLCQGLDALVARGTEAPNSLNLRALSPEKFAVQLTLRRSTAAELFDALEKCQGWLLQQGYKPI